MKNRLWQGVGVLAVAPATYGFLTWLDWWTGQVTR